MVFEGIYFDGNDLADFGFKALYNGGPTYNAQFRNVIIDRGATGRTAWIAVDWCGTGTTSNCEQLVVEGLHLIGSGHGSTSIGIRIGHSNSVQNKIDGTTISYFNQGVRIGGTVQVTRNLFDNNNVDISCQGSESMEIAFNRTENGRQFFNGNCPIFMHDNRFGSHDGSPASAWINIGANASTATLVFINNVFTLTDTLAPFAGASRLFSANNLYPTAAISNGVVTSMETFN